MMEITVVEVMTLMETESLTQTMLALMSHQPQKMMPIVMGARMMMEATVMVMVTAMVTETVEAIIPIQMEMELLMTMITVLILWLEIQ